MSFKNIVLLTDFYKPSHWKQTPPGMEASFSYFESRGGYTADTMFFGLKYYLKKYLSGNIVTPSFIQEGKEVCDDALGPGIFNIKGWEYIAEKHHGKLPIRIRAVPEGSIIPIKNALMTVENLDPACYWLTNYLETLLSLNWYPITVATYDREVKKILKQYLRLTGTVNNTDHMFHDFGFRGSSSVETAAIGGAAHLINFAGTDTIPGWLMLRQYYGGVGNRLGDSIPAAEHFTITSWGRDFEKDAFRNMLTQFPEGPVAIVADSYNIYEACETFGTMFKEDILNRDGLVVIRPDSGDPLEVLPKIFDILGTHFGFTVNQKGYKILPDQLRVIQGDGVDLEKITLILQKMMDLGWSADNIAFGCGGALLQKHDRDTHKFAFKCSAAKVNGEWRDVYKDPITDHGKKSKAGRLDLIKTSDGYRTVRIDHQAQHAESVLQTVFEKGDILVDDDLDTIRKRAS
jgi:nicotinamide phosphoribosyltransferase